MVYSTDHKQLNPRLLATLMDGVSAREMLARICERSTSVHMYMHECLYVRMGGANVARMFATM